MSSQSQPPTLGASQTEGDTTMTSRYSVTITYCIGPFNGQDFRQVDADTERDAKRLALAKFRRERPKAQTRNIVAHKTETPR